MAIKLTYGKHEKELELLDNENVSVAGVNRSVNRALQKGDKFITVKNKDGKSESIVAAEVIRVWEE